MLIVSSREFRQNQKYYLDLIDNNENIIVQRGRDRAYKITPVNQADTLLSQDEFEEKINRSIQQALEGNLIDLSKEQQDKLLSV